VNIFQKIEAWVETLLKPEGKVALAAGAEYLTTNKAKLVSEGATSGQTAEVFLENTAVAFITKENPTAAEMAQPLIHAFLIKELGFGENDLGTLIDKLAAFLVTEEQYV
jgi:hypothetical protein